MGLTTRIRDRDIRLNLPTDPGVDADERALLKGRYFEAVCTAADLAGDFVSINGPESAGFYSVGKVDPLVSATMPAIGVITSKSTATRCFVQTLGELAAIGLTPGGRYWIGRDAQIAASWPVPLAGEVIVVQVVGVALTATKLLLRPDLSPVKLRG
jgi:hypothetical protein